MITPADLRRVIRSHHDEYIACPKDPNHGKYSRSWQDYFLLPPDSEMTCHFCGAEMAVFYDKIERIEVKI